jgi:hypothetical protein
MNHLDEEVPPSGEHRETDQVEDGCSWQEAAISITRGGGDISKRSLYPEQQQR